MKTSGVRGKCSLDACRTVVAIEEAIDAGEKCPPTIASKAAKRIVGCYQARACIDVETYLASLVATLARYPGAVVKMAACIEHGIPRKHKFLPSIAEIADELDAMVTNVSVVARFARRALQVAE